ncbi:MAG: hypothetical protein ABIQ95_03675 [Bdellovibrionia bacterium]
MKNLKFVVCLSFISATAFGSVFSTLTPEEQASIQNGDLVTVNTPNQDTETTWPKCAAYKRIEATPEEAAAVYADFEIQKDYIRHLKVSHIAQKLSPASFIVDYEIKVPFFFKPFVKVTTYSVKDDLSFDSAANTYVMDWVLSKAGFLKNIVGRATFEPLGTGTMIAYVNEMSPAGTGMNAGMVVKEIKKGSKEVVEDIASKILSERKNHQEILQKQILNLREVFSK